jgi:hypothetical protein
MYERYTFTVTLKTPYPVSLYGYKVGGLSFVSVKRLGCKHILALQVLP